MEENKKEHRTYGLTGHHYAVMMGLLLMNSAFVVVLAIVMIVDVMLKI